MNRICRMCKMGRRLNSNDLCNLCQRLMNRFEEIREEEQGIPCE